VTSRNKSDKEFALDEIRLTIDGQEVEARKGMTVLEAAQGAGIYIPTLCADPDLEPYAGCRLCVVEVEGRRDLVTACTMPARDGMVVHTETPAVNKVRRGVVELLIADHPSNCLTCPSNQQCELQKVAAYLGITEERFRKTTRVLPIDSSNPFFDFDRNRCILCAKCVRTCNEITCIGAIDLVYRGYEGKVATFDDGLLIDSICQSCGECVVRCPVGALTPKETRQPTREVKTICPYCGVGCGIILGMRGRELITVQGDRENPVNRGRLCVKGRFGIVDFVSHPDRLRSPLIRKDGELVEASWDEALDLVASRLDKYRGDVFAGISSAKCTNEENYIFQKFTRAVMGTNSVDHCARL
jgi:formate dehydrogenase alpha subunit